MYGCSSELKNIFPVSVSQNRKPTATCLIMGIQIRFPGHMACLSLNLTVL